MKSNKKRVKIEDINGVNSNYNNGEGALEYLLNQPKEQNYQFKTSF